MIDHSSLAEAVSRLSSRFTGELLVSGDPHYDEARKVHNGLIDKRPALIARCRGVAAALHRPQAVLSRAPRRNRRQRGDRHARA